MHTDINLKTKAIRGRGKVVAARTGRSKKKKRAPEAFPPLSDPDAYTLREFCARHRVSRPLYYRLKKRGLGPREIRLNSKVLITREAAVDWRRAREAATANAA